MPRSSPGTPGKRLIKREEYNTGALGLDPGVHLSIIDGCPGQARAPRGEEYILGKDNSGAFGLDPEVHLKKSTTS
jgi:hypothetical protein